MSDDESPTQNSRVSMGSHDRKLRYRALLEDLSCIEEDSGNAERMEATTRAVRSARSLLAEGAVEERVRHPGEGFLDSRVLHATSHLVVRCSEAVSGNVNLYDHHQLAAHIKENPEFWEFTFPNEVPAYSYLFGTFAPTPPEERPKKPRKKIEKQAASALKKPEDVDQLEKTEEGSEMVSRVNKFISRTFKSKGGAPLSYFHVVLDPQSFARTVENIYHVSFLVRDGLISVNIDEDVGLPFIKPVPPAQRENDKRNLSDENQFIVSMNMQRWQALIKAFKISKPTMVLKRI